jgi:hypothetical protein
VNTTDRLIIVVFLLICSAPVVWFTVRGLRRQAAQRRAIVARLQRLGWLMRESETVGVDLSAAMKRLADEATGPHQAMDPEGLR